MKSVIFALILLSTWIAGAAPSPNPRVVCTPWRQLNDDEKNQAEIYLRNLQTQGQILRNRYPLNFSLTRNPVFLERLARGILQNETGCRDDQFIFWNRDESFPSLGMLHAIWYPRGERSNLVESFPEMIKYLRAQLRANPQAGVNVPAWLNRDDIGRAPWNTKTEFDQAMRNAEILRQNGDLANLTPTQREQALKYREIHNFLRDPRVLALQARFAAQRMQNSVYSILAAAENQNADAVRNIYTQLQRLATTEEGIFSLIDYTSFKGEGLSPGEVTTRGGHAWGLKTVLEQMSAQSTQRPVCNRGSPEFNDGRCANVQFTASAYHALRRRAENSGEPGSVCQRQALADVDGTNGRRGGWTARLQDNYMPGALAQPRCTGVEIRSTERATPRSVVAI